MSFKVGDRVRVYGHPRVRKEYADGLVESVDNIVWLCVDADEANNKKTLLFNVHPKQCRKLVKKPSRVWLLQKRAGLLGDWVGTEVDPKKPMPPATNGFIYVREFKP